MSGAVQGAAATTAALPHTKNMRRAAFAVC